MTMQRGPTSPPSDGEPPVAPGPLVRPYTMTGGRTRPVLPGLDMISVVVAARREVDVVSLAPEHREILSASRGPVSVAELSAHLDLPVTVVKVLVSDLVSQDALLTRDPEPAAGIPELNVLQAVLDGIRRL